MHSPPLEWSLGIGHLAILDWIRDRGEPDSDTLSECIREAFQVHSPRGYLTFTATVVAGAVLFHRHICKPTTPQPVPGRVGPVVLGRLTVD